MGAAVRLDEPDPEGWRRFRLELLARRGRRGADGGRIGLEVLDPPEVRERIVASATRLLDRYRVVRGDETA